MHVTNISFLIIQKLAFLLALKNQILVFPCMYLLFIHKNAMDT